MTSSRSESPFDGRVWSRFSREASFTFGDLLLPLLALRETEGEAKEKWASQKVK
jgi:hypothetical protein